LYKTEKCAYLPIFRDFEELFFKKSCCLELEDFEISLFLSVGLVQPAIRNYVNFQRI